MFWIKFHTQPSLLLGKIFSLLCFIPPSLLFAKSASVFKSRFSSAPLSLLFLLWLLGLIDTDTCDNEKSYQVNSWSVNRPQGIFWPVCILTTLILFLLLMFTFFVWFSLFLMFVSHRLQQYYKSKSMKTNYKQFHEKHILVLLDKYDLFFFCPGK